MKKILTLTIILLAAISCSAKPKEYKLKVVKEYTHDTKAYTQGLYFLDGTMYESAGQFSESNFREVDYTTGKVVRKMDFAAKYFLEGATVLDGKLFILTWTNKVAFVYDAKTLEYKQSYSYPREGWGLTTDGKSLIASDGSSRIYYMTTEFKVTKTLNVTMNGKPLRYLNELEWIDGKIWANVYLTDLIVIINSSSGEVEASIDCSGLLPSKLRGPKTDVLNGIAYLPGPSDSKSSYGSAGRIFLTGKYWPRLYEVQLIAK